MKKTFLVLVAMLMALQLYAQKTLSGKVLDAYYKTALSGVEIKIEDSSLGTLTDDKGFFQINISKSDLNKKLFIAYPNYETLRIDMPQKEQVEIVLFPFREQVDTVLTFDPETYEEQIQVVTHQTRLKLSNGKLPANAQNTKAAIPYGYNTEDYSIIIENEDQNVNTDPLSTFSIDVDKAAYSNVRRFLNQHKLPPVDAVRLEEMINYFDYDYDKPKKNESFSFTSELTTCPWNKDRQLLQIGLQGQEINTDDLPPSNLVFLLDVSGSMNGPNKLDLLKSAFKLLVNQLKEEDKIAIVVYAGAAGLVLPSTPGSDKITILKAIDDLHAGGSTAGGAGIELAYKVAKENYLPNGNNRIILATDGDFNVGVSNEGGLGHLIESKRDDNIFISVLGFGMGNYKDNKLEILANKGNGNYAYIDNIQEAKKTFINDILGTLYTIAKDVKIQIEFNPYFVKSYRLVGYENRILQENDFDNDKKDAGELGAGHKVTALYELVPNERNQGLVSSNPLRYQRSQYSKIAKKGKEIATIKFRYKEPKENKSELITLHIRNKFKTFEKTSENCQFSAAVAGFGLLLRTSSFNKSLNYEDVLTIARKNLSKDKKSYRLEFIELVEKAKSLALVDN